MHCERCNEPVIEIDYYGERLVGCLECNCWQSSKNAFIVELTVEDIQALRDRDKRFDDVAGAKAILLIAG
jgi:hypothetical protein